MAFSKGQSGNPRGKPKGARNKVNLELKEMILTALEESGGVDYLKRQANENPTAFLTLIGKILPMTIGGDQDAPPVLKIIREFVDVPQKALPPSVH